MKKQLRIAFMGTPDFAIPSLKILLENNYNVVTVVTTPDKPAGRGKKVLPSPVKEFADIKNLRILQPFNLKDFNFIKRINNLNINLQVVVAFRILPAEVWKIPKFGSFNLHASLLPQYRGAAPINRVIMNGETETGVTTFFIDNNIDTGKIIFREKISIMPDETAGQLHDRLMNEGAHLVLKTVKAIEDNKYTTITQPQLITQKEKIKTAPKIFREDREIDWYKSKQQIYDLIRGLSPYPAAFTYLLSPDNISYNIKIFEALPLNNNTTNAKKPGSVITDSKTYLHVATSNGFIKLISIQLESKNKMNIDEFLRGFKIDNSWKMVKQRNLH